MNPNSLEASAQSRTSQKVKTVHVGDYDEPSWMDFFSDGSSCTDDSTRSLSFVTSKNVYNKSTTSLGRSIGHSLQEATSISYYARPRRKIAHNPSGGEVRRRESDEPWMSSALNQIRRENGRARVVLQEKRIFGLAKQTVTGLSQLGIKYEMTTLANKLRDAYRYQAQRCTVESEPGNEDIRLISADVLMEKERLLLLLEACKQYNLNRIAELLEIQIPRRVTFGDT